MPALVRGEVMAANDAWVWMPEDATSIDAADYLLALYPAYVGDATQVLCTSAGRTPAELVTDVMGQARDHDRAHVVWWVHDLSEPTGLEDHLLSLGGEPTLTLSVLAKALDQPIPPVPDEPKIRAVADRATVVDNHRVGIEVFDESMPAEQDLAREVERLATSDDGDRPATTLVAYVDDEPVGIGGVTVVEGVARLWGGGTVPAARRQGVYAALLRARLNWALEHGATFALTRGRVDTSAPILRRAGFGIFGERRGYRIST